MKKFGLIAAVGLVLCFGHHHGASAGVCGNGSTCIEHAVTITNSTGTGALNLYTASGNGAKILSIICNSNVSPPALNVSILSSATSYPLFATSVALNAGGIGTGTAGSAVPVANIMATASTYGAPLASILPLDENGNPFFLVNSGDSVQLASQTTIAGGSAITCTIFGIQY